MAPWTTGLYEFTLAIQKILEKTFSYADPIVLKYTALNTMFEKSQVHY